MLAVSTSNPSYKEVLEESLADLRSLVLLSIHEVKDFDTKIGYQTGLSGLCAQVKKKLSGQSLSERRESERTSNAETLKQDLAEIHQLYKNVLKEIDLQGRGSVLL